MTEHVPPGPHAEARLAGARRLPALLFAAAVVTALVAWTLDWASMLQALVFAIAVGLATVLGAIARRRTETVLRAEIERRRDAEQEARAANRAKSEFLANMSHELRTPLATVIGTADLLLAAELPPRERRHLEVIDAATEALQAQIDDVLDFAKLEVGRLRLEEVDFGLRELVSQVRDLTAPRAAEKGLALDFTVAPELFEALHGDPARLRQVLLNLVGNAVKFTRQGRVEVTVSGEGDKEGSWIRFSVRDTGIGISEPVRRHIFETFYQADSTAARHAGGSGLGLAISKELVELMGGEIGVESEHGAGSTFWFLIPRVRARGKVSDSGAVAPASAVDRGCFRVLVVEDSPTNRALALGHLEVQGYRAAAAADGATALARLAKERFDAVLMDCQMPELDGYETTRRLRRAERERGASRIPVIALTAHALPGEREKCLAVGMDDHLSKPYRGVELGAVLDRHLLASDVPAKSPVSRPRGIRTHEAALVKERLDALRQLAAQSGRDVVDATLASFRREGPTLLAAMHRALEEGDSGALAMAAHSLAGTSGMLGGARLAESLLEVEKGARSGELGELGEPLGQAEREYERFSRALANL